jgi:hypothetical protein
MKYLRILLSSVFLLPFGLRAQEMRLSLQSNPMVRDHEEMHKSTKSTQVNYLNLPFIDDFSATQNQPDPLLWSDQNVYINSCFPKDPISIGVATFDALDATGALYPAASSLKFRADLLTSQPFHMDYQPEDNIYLSFFYQAQGLGDRPESGDSLLVEFFAPYQNTWKLVFGIPGDSVRPFKEAIIPVRDTAWLHTGFRFRFVNLASLAKTAQDPGKIDNDDHWNIDYVRLETNRSDTDTLVDDVAFTSPLYSCLYDYESVPWTHYPMLANKQARPFLILNYYNNFNLTRKVDRNFSVKGNTYNYNYILTSENITGNSLQEYRPDLEKIPPGSGDSAKFLVRSWLTTDNLLSSKAYRWNDTINYVQKFSNYYAYDDGSAETGYGLSGEGTNGAKLGLQFIAPISDTLRGIMIYFNRSYKDANLNINFQLAVWNNSNGRPGDLIYSEDVASITSKYSGLNHFNYYKFSSPVFVPDTFYVGWIQTAETYLNVGLDLNRIHNNRAYYNINGTWYPSSIKGSIMLRPILGKDFNTAVRNVTLNRDQRLKIYPNPATNTVSIRMDDPTQAFGTRLSIYSMQGVLLQSYNELPQTIDVTALKPGPYLILTTSSRGEQEWQKLLIVR